MEEAVAAMARGKGEALSLKPKRGFSLFYFIVFV